MSDQRRLPEDDKRAVSSNSNNDDLLISNSKVNEDKLPTEDEVEVEVERSTGVIDSLRNSRYPSSGNLPWHFDIPHHLIPSTSHFSIITNRNFPILDRF